MVVSGTASLLSFHLGVFSQSGPVVGSGAEPGPSPAVLICPSAMCSAERTSGLGVDYLHSVSGSIIDPLPLTACGS